MHRSDVWVLVVAVIVDNSKPRLELLMAINIISNARSLSGQGRVSKQTMEGASVGSEDIVLALQRMRKLAKFMDTAYRIPGTNFRFGWDSILGLIPGVGDLATGIVSASIVGYALRMGVRKRTVARMLANLGVDMTVGVVPLLGDLFDASFKANIRNVALLEREMARRGQARRS